MAAKDTVLDTLNKASKTVGDLADNAKRKTQTAAESASQLPSMATAGISRKVVSTACDSLEIAVEEVRRRNLSRHPVTISTTIALGPAEIVVSVQLEAVPQTEETVTTADAT